MANPSYNCVFCTYKSSNQYMVSHYLSNHKEELSKYDTLNMKVAAKHGNLVAIPMILEKEKKRMDCCLGCKTFYNNGIRASKHREACKKKEEHKKICSSILPTIENTVEDTSEAIAPLKAEIVKLRKQIDKQAADLKDYETVDCSIQILQSVLSSLPAMMQREIHRRCVELEREKKERIDDWNTTEWEEWFDSDMIEGNDEGSIQGEEREDEVPVSDEE